MKKHSNKKNSSKFPFENETKQAKNEFIKMIESMPDDEFACFIVLFFDFLETQDFLDDEDEDDLPF